MPKLGTISSNCNSATDSLSDLLILKGYLFLPFCQSGYLSNPLPTWPRTCILLETHLSLLPPLGEITHGSFHKHPLPHCLIILFIHCSRLLFFKEIVNKWELVSGSVIVFWGLHTKHPGFAAVICLLHLAYPVIVVFTYKLILPSKYLIIIFSLWNVNILLFFFHLLLVILILIFWEWMSWQILVYQVRSQSQNFWKPKLGRYWCIFFFHDIMFPAKILWFSFRGSQLPTLILMHFYYRHKKHTTLS